MLPKLLDPRPYFANLPDPRRETRNKLHPLQDILMIVLCAALSGVEDWVGIEAFAEEKEAWLQGFLDLPNGIPSHDTLSDVMGRIDPGAFRLGFTVWATAALPNLAGEQVCVDGKAVRGSRDGEHPAVHLVSAFAGQARWVLAQQAVAEKSNEITAIPDLLALLDLQGAVVSADAMSYQKAIAQTIVEGGADSVLALKDNPPTLCEDVQLWLDTEVTCRRLPVQETVEKDHGRLEIRHYALSSHIDWLEAKPDWAGLQAVGRVESTRIIGDQTSTECRYFLCSFPDRERFAAAVRGHWGIENQQHWVLDVQFGENACRTRKDHSAENLALIRRVALNVLRHNGPARDSIRRCKLRAALNDDYRLRLLFGQLSPATT
ncbi:MAG: ISAs1 family transposase [Candidatus Competibacteraceae bacterium]|nr:ISAs1 family transposase [Candidatus Competibacteraceae bacterium]MCB1821952.1 ISAs1 family transposase [Candidatus Competibacteraceae bacterium]